MRIGFSQTRRCSLGWTRVAAILLAVLVGVTGSSFALESEPVAGPAEHRDSQSAQNYRLPPDKLAKATTLGHIRTGLHFGSELWQILVLLALLASGIAARLGTRVANRTGKGWLQGLLFSLLMVTLLYLVSTLPPEAIGHAFSLHYGISVQGWNSWLLDEAKTLSLVIALETPTLMLVFGLMHWGWSRKRYWLWIWIAAVPTMLLGAFVEPQIFEPIFNTFEPLSKTHPQLVRELQKVVARTGTSIPPERMFSMKASAKSNGLNAYVSGIGASKRVVVWDTTADRMPTDEILFTFGHESGHYVLNHIPKGLTFAAAGMFFLFWLTAGLASWMVRRWGDDWDIDSVASLPGLAVLLLAFALLQVVAEPIQSTASRYAEHEADIYGQEAVHGIVTDPQKTAVAAFNALGEAYLDDPNPNSFVEFWSYDHPSIRNRANFAAQYDPWKIGQEPRFFPK